MDEHWLWPLKGGTWKERLLTLADVLELILMASTLYFLAWALASYF